MNPVFALDLGSETAREGEVVIAKSDDSSVFLTQNLITSTIYLESPTMTKYLESPTMQDVLDRISSLEKEMKRLVSRMEEISKNLGSHEEAQEMFEVKDIPYEEAKQEIAKYFLDHDGREIGYEELQDAFHLDIKTILRACDDLVKEGKIG